MVQFIDVDANPVQNRSLCTVGKILSVTRDQSVRSLLPSWVLSLNYSTPPLPGSNESLCTLVPQKSIDIKLYLFNLLKNNVIILIWNFSHALPESKYKNCCSEKPFTDRLHDYLEEL